MYIKVRISQQKLQLLDNNGDVLMDTLVSIARNGPGRHHAPDTDVMGVPGCHGCIKKSKPDVMTLFDRVEVGTPVVISE